MMTDLELRKLAQMIVEEQIANPQWMAEFAKAQSKVRKDKVRAHWVNTKAAADILGISVRSMRDIKKHFTHIKSGDEKQSNVYFDANLLEAEYDKYLASKKKVIMLAPVSRAAAL